MLNAARKAKELETILYDALNNEQEELQKAASKCFKFIDHKNTFIAGATSDEAKWYWFAKFRKEEKLVDSYSEEEVLKIIIAHTDFLVNDREFITLSDWFEQFKKK